VKRSIGSIGGTGRTKKSASTSRIPLFTCSLQGAAGIVAAEFGRGFGKHLLSSAVRDAWALAPSRVWLHTCTLDHPNALPNYLARGFTPYRKETYEVDSAP